MPPSSRGSNRSGSRSSKGSTSKSTEADADACDDVPSIAPTWVLPKQFTKEIRQLGLSVGESTRLAQLMEDHRLDRTGPKDHKKLDRGVEELRLAGDRRAIRIYFGRVDNETVLLVAVHAKQKQRDNDRTGKDLAARRLQGFKNGTWGGS